MSRRALLASPFVLALLASAAAPVACGGDDSAPVAPVADASIDSAPPGPDTSAPLPQPDASIVVCALGGGTDPVALCVQKQVLRGWHKVFDPSAGVAAAWSVDTGKPLLDGGATVHDAHDDVGYGAALALYSSSANQYGDTELSTTIAADLGALAPLVEAELATLPAEYSGVLYRRLRAFAGGLRSRTFTDDATKIDAIADAYGRALYTTYFHPLAPGLTPDAGAVDAGSDAGDDGGTDAAAASDASLPSDASTDADAGAPPPPPLGDGILGTPVAGGSGFSYRTDDAATGALALMDMAARHAADDPTNATLWARAGGSVLNHLYARARHASGLYYAALATSADPNHDALQSGPSPNDTLLADTQSAVALTLMRGLGLVLHANLGALATYPFADHAAPLFAALQAAAPGVSLWDTTTTSATLAACNGPSPATPCGSGFFASYAPSTSVFDKTKTIRSNVQIFGALHRANIQLPTTIPQTTDLLPLRALFVTTSGLDVSFLTQTFQQSGFLGSVSQKLDFVSADPSARAYRSQANADVIDALTDQWIGVHGSPTDVY